MSERHINVLNNTSPPKDMTVAEVIEEKEGSIQLGTPEPFAGSKHLHKIDQN